MQTNLTATEKFLHVTSVQFHKLVFSFPPIIVSLSSLCPPRHGFSREHRGYEPRRSYPRCADGLLRHEARHLQLRPLRASLRPQGGGRPDARRGPPGPRGTRVAGRLGQPQVRQHPGFVLLRQKGKPAFLTQLRCTLRSSLLSSSCTLRVPFEKEIKEI